MERFKQLLIFILFLFIISCKSTPTPVNLNEEPKLNLTENMTPLEEDQAKYEYTLSLKKYIRELISQIKNKVPYNDFRNIE